MHSLLITMVLRSLVWLALGASARNSTLVRLDEDRGALCLDGRPGGYYFRAGAASSKWYIHHEGGGWCQMERPYESWPNDNCGRFRVDGRRSRVVFSRVS